MTKLMDIRGTEEAEPPYATTRNACKLCAPLGASVVFKGIQGCLPMIHGSQGCATYIRRYMISHYKEPVDIASSNFSEETTIFGGNKNFNASIQNIIGQYHPEAIGIASTCLSETIGEDVSRLIREFASVNSDAPLPVLISASTPSYQGSHMDGFHEAVASVIASLAERGETGTHITLFPGFVSPQDIRHLKDIVAEWKMECIVFPDYSDPLDNPSWDEYKLISDGGTPIRNIRRTGSARASIEFGYVFNTGKYQGSTKKNMGTGGDWLENQCGVPTHKLGMPIGINETDRFFALLESLSGKPIPERYRLQRGRLIDAYVDGHKYLFGKRAIVYGEEDFVIGLVSFLSEIGIETVLVTSGGTSGVLKELIPRITNSSTVRIMDGSDFETMNELADGLHPDIMIGNSKGYYIARRLNIPLVRVGFPIHDRVGGQRLQHLCYEGTHHLFDRITNALIEYKQDNSPVGYKYI
ncbi:MAG TPA: nitrogenase component 1 [Bacteroidota bacterium]|nr:nitrogenase component 1 [Bacteroidota bacterium]